MTSIRVDYAVVAAAQENIQAGANRIHTTLDEMDAQLAPLAEQWTGLASNSYRTAQAEWTAALQDMNQTLNQIRALLGESAQGFDASDRAGASLFGR